MLMDERVTRRSFLRGLFTAAAGASLNSFIPLPLKPLVTGSLTREARPYWLEVLSKGVRFFPENIVSRFSDWGPDRLRESSHYTLVLTLGQNRKMLAGTGMPGDREMDGTVERNKTAQYLYESFRLAEAEEDEESDGVHADDPFHARLLYDLSSFILRHTMDRVDDPSFEGFTPFDTTLLGSGLTYVREAINLNEDASVLCGSDLREVLTSNTGSCYNNLGLTLSYLGEVQQAQAAFGKALELRPDNRAILRNLHDMDANGLIIRRRLYSRTLVD
jgi:tetratricopeptide (TPR) repeat protein